VRRNEPALSEYQPLVQKLLDVLGPMMAAGSAAGADRRGHLHRCHGRKRPVPISRGRAAAQMLDDRRATDDATFMAGMRAQFGLTQAMPERHPGR
jgi:hypothetical protein